MASRDTIYAVSSGAGRAGIAVVRISGPAATEVVERMAPPMPKPRFAAFRRILHPETGEQLDEAIAIFFAGPRTETGEDMLELQIHGGRAVIGSVLGGLSLIPGCRPAEPGEFSRRAFEAGKIDLTKAEALADLVDAETDAQRRQALSQLGGALTDLYDGWRQEMISALALVEAAIDFSDEPDVASDAFEQARDVGARLSERIKAHLDDGHRGEIVRDGYRIVLAGPPNVGKSSLLNALARRDAAIVSEEAGTTRDVIEVRLDLGGVPVIVSDTAGLREPAGPIEREGIRRTLQTVRGADLMLWLMDARMPARDLPPELDSTPILRVLNKADLGLANVLGPGDIAVSALTGEGLTELTKILAETAKERIETCVGSPALTQARHRSHLEAALRSLEAFMTGPGSDAELRAEDLRQAAASLGRITGRVDAEDVLGAIFGRFCVGK